MNTVIRSDNFDFLDLDYRVQLLELRSNLTGLGYGHNTGHPVMVVVVKIVVVETQALATKEMVVV